ncbi:hypothetical protein [Paenibacillus mendelii]|uniref:DUF4025 domain-containing protein n=1 Tax=Paenibacillus mendelii TaxID=206163 RepID=A0ABV6J606_9BACL|nr:hypothetical protein [Paenibacillus mendelii]MCQ6559987.1 hypothetical protein [Paenibacillus mendelii]
MKGMKILKKVNRNHNEHDPIIAPGMNTSDPLEEKASDEEIERGQYTEVTSLFLDRTPED